jgi:hypothetical protein
MPKRDAFCVHLSLGQAVQVFQSDPIIRVRPPPSRLAHLLVRILDQTKRAAQLLRRYATLDAVLEAGLFRAEAKMLRLYRLIATMDAKAPLPSLADQQPTWSSASDLARSWGLNQLADRLHEKVQPP